MKYFFLTVMFFGAFFFTSIKAQNTVISLADKEELLQIGKKVTYLEDKDTKWTIKEILSEEKQALFKKNKKDVFTRPGTTSAFWFKIETKNTSIEDSWLEVATTYPWRIEFYSPNNDYQSHTTGSIYDDTTKLYQVNLFWFPLNKAKDNKVKTYYIRVEEGLTFELPLYVGTIRSLSKNKVINDYLTAGFVGIMLIMILYNSFLLFATKDRVYGYYIGYLFMMLISMTYANGYPFIQYLDFGFIDKYWIHRHFLVWHSFAYLFVGLFCIRYLNLNKNKGIIAKRIILGQLFFIVGVFPVLSLVGFKIQNIVTAFQGIFFLLYITCLITAYYYALKKDKQARFYALGWTFMIIGVFIFLLVLYGYLPFNPYTRNVLYFGVALEVWMFSLALGDRMNVIRREKEVIQAENIKIIKEQKEVLEMKVKERTLQLQEKKDEIMTQNEELLQKQEEVEMQRNSLLKQNLIIERKNKNITSSISYAKQIQGAILPSISEIKEVLPKSMIFFRPKDVVSGDFYYFSKKRSKVFFASVDCTGHGVPGAFMSLIGNDLLHQIIHAKNIVRPDKILNELKTEITRTLKQKKNTNNDGMDISLCMIDFSLETPYLEYAGAKQPLIYFKEGKLNKIKGDKIIIGGATQYFKGQEFTLHKIFIDSPTTFYLCSDGIQDQFGGKESKKFMPKRLNQLLIDIHQLPFSTQKAELEEKIDNWQGKNIQIDDMLLIGFKLEKSSNIEDVK